MECNELHLDMQAESYGAQVMLQFQWHAFTKIHMEASIEFERGADSCYGGKICVYLCWFVCSGIKISTFLASYLCCFLS